MCTLYQIIIVHGERQILYNYDLYVEYNDDQSQCNLQCKHPTCSETRPSNLVPTSQVARLAVIGTVCEFCGHMGGSIQVSQISGSSCTIYQMKYLLFFFTW